MIAALAGGSFWALAEPRFSNHDNLSNSVISDGTITLEWNSEQSIVLEHARSREFAKPWVRYRGNDQSSVLTGLAEGEHFFRIKEEGEETSWSKVLPVQVEFVDLTLMYFLLAVGGAVSLLTVGAIIYGSRKTKYLRNQVP